jgi:membrane dipeptidase
VIDPMNRLNAGLLVAALVAAAAPPGGAQSTPPPAAAAHARDERLWQRALRLHRSAIVVDTHSDTPSRLVDEGFDMGARSTTGHMDIPRMREGGLDAEFFVAYVSKSYATEGGAARRALDMIAAIHDQIARHPDALELALTEADVRRIARKGKIAALVCIEGGHAIEDSLAALGMFHRLGVRYMTLTHSNTNNWADSSGDAARWGGLNDFGRDVVREMNRLGILVDISHVSDLTFFDAVEVSKAPVIASHSSARALSNHPRNMTDDMLRAVAKNGGVVMVNFYSTFLDQRRVDASAALEPERLRIRERFGTSSAAAEREIEALEKANPLPETPLSLIIDHIDHVARVAGIDHVGLGSDFDGVDSLPVGMEDVSKLPAITYELLERGYSEADVRKVLGENFLRVMAEAERVSAAMRRAEPAR